MARKTERVAYCLTFLLKREGELWASVTPELGAASCGETAEHAREMLKSAIRARYRAMSEKGWDPGAWRAMTEEQVEDFKADPAGEVVSEAYVMVITRPLSGEQPSRASDLRVEFVRSAEPPPQPRTLAVA